MTQENIALLAHLLRRAGFGANRDELESYATKGYEATVEELLHPENAPPALDDEDLFRRYHVERNSDTSITVVRSYWLYRMINTKRPLEEKIALFWHGVFATGWVKVGQTHDMANQVDMFRRYGLGSFRDLLMQVSMDPAMLFWLDNTDNHRDAVNENYGRELLELFSMGVGNYSEDDVRQASRAFTGWTIHDVDFHKFRNTGRLSSRTESQPGSLNTGNSTTMMSRRRSWERPAPSTARTLSIPYAGSRRRPGLWHATSITTLSPTNPRCRPGRRSSLGTRRQSKR